MTQVRVRVSRDFLELVEKNVLSSRPAWRVNASSIDNTADAALLIPDHSLFSGTHFAYIHSSSYRNLNLVKIKKYY